MSFKAPSAGELDTFVTIVRIANSPDDEVELSTEEVEVLTRWAKIEPVGTAIYVGTAQTGTGITHRIYIDFTTLVQADDVVKTNDGRRFRVHRSAAMNGGRVCTILEVEELTQQV